MAERGPSPVACDLTALSSEERARRSELEARLRTNVLEFGETGEGVKLRLGLDRSACAWLGEFVALESRCCPFLRFELVLEADDGPIWLRLGGRPEAQAFLRGWLAGSASSGRSRGRSSPGGKR